VVIKYKQTNLTGTMSSDAQCKEPNARFTMAPLKPLCVRVFRNMCVKLSYSACIQLKFWTRQKHKGFKGTVVNQALYSLHEGSIEITLTVPLKNILSHCFKLENKANSCL